MSCAGASLKNLWINALTVITDAQPKPSLVIPDFHLDPRSLCMLEGVAYRLARNAVNIVSQNRSKFPRRALHLHQKVGTMIRSEERRVGKEGRTRCGS